MKKIQLMTPFLDDVEISNLKKTLDSGWLTQGSAVKKFEEKFCNFHKVNYGAALTSATAGLHLALMALNLKPGGEVIVPSFTWVSSVNCILYNNLKPKIIDVDHKTFNSSIEQILEAINKKTVAIVVVNLFGLLVDLKKLKVMLPKNIKIIEDSACAIGSKFNDDFSGKYSDYSIFSFHPRKIITTGEGGIVVSNSKKRIDKIKILRDHGASSDDISQHLNIRPPHKMSEFSHLGFNYRMSDISASIGLGQLSKLDQIILRRREVAQLYFNLLKDVKWLNLPVFSQNIYHTYQSFVCLIKKGHNIQRNMLLAYLSEKGIATRPGTHAVHNLVYYKRRFGFKTMDFPFSNYCEKNSFTLPLHFKLNKQDYIYISEMIKSYK